MNAADFARVKSFLDGGGVGTLRVNPSTVSDPVFQQHGNGGGSATILALFYIGNIKPDSGFFLRRRLGRAPQEKKKEQAESNSIRSRKPKLLRIKISEAQ